MLRLHRFLLAGVVFLSLWAAIVSKVITVDFIGPKEMLVVQPVGRAPG